jgi:hypothetical protein
VQESVQTSLFEAAPLREPAARVAGGSDLLRDRVRLARLRESAPNRRHFCLQAGLEPGPVSYARINAALIAAGVAPYTAVRRAA